MVPGNLGCGVSVFAATAMFAPSRAALSAIASPMPREAPVMNSVLPLSDIPASRLSCKRRLRRDARNNGAICLHHGEQINEARMQLTGIHHLTAISADAPGNKRFYT